MNINIPFLKKEHVGSLVDIIIGILIVNTVTSLLGTYLDFFKSLNIVIGVILVLSLLFLRSKINKWLKNKKGRSDFRKTIKKDKKDTTLMKNRTLLLFLLLFLPISVVAEYSWICPQETATSATTCGGLSTGTYVYNASEWNTTYPAGNVIDGNYGTYGKQVTADTPNFAYVMVNYTKPLGAQNTSVWNFSYYNAFGAGGVQITNIQLPQQCWNAYSDRVFLRAGSWSTLTLSYRQQRYECYNGTDWELLGGVSYQDPGAYTDRVPEESMTWNISFTNLPVVNITIMHQNIPNAFNTTANLGFVCTTNYSNNITVNVTVNNQAIYNSTMLNNSQLNFTLTSYIINGVNNITINCSVAYPSGDYGSAQTTLSNTTYKYKACLWDEKDNTIFNLANVTGARLYIDDNSTYYDFKTSGATCTNYSSSNNATSKIRFEFIYAAGDVITRYIDSSLVGNELTDDQLRICINKQGVTHYEQLIISSTNRPVILKSVFSECLIAADYTRFAYQDAYLLKAFTINNNYYVYIFSDGLQTFLIGLDGSISTYINLDTIEFQQTGYNIGIAGDGLAFEKTGDTEITIYYNNVQEENTAVRTTITRMDTDETIFDSSSFTDPNNFTIVMDYSTLTNVSNTTLFQITLDKTTNSGSKTTKKYFNTSAKKGSIPSGVAFAISFLLTIFGLTFTLSRITFGWFGVIVMIASIGILSFSLGAWYTTMLLAMDVIILIWIIILMVIQNNPVAT